jgi:hypothetical protein
LKKPSSFFPLRPFIPTYLLHPATGLRYLDFMKICLFLAVVLLFTACAGRKITNRHAQSVISNNALAPLNDSDIEVVSVSQTSKSEAIVETKIKTAFRLEKKGNHWTVQEARPGHGQWEKMRNIEQALTQIKIAETQDMLNRIADAILLYKRSNGKAPVFKDYVSLSDILSPQYLTPLLRLDAWTRPLEAIPSAPSAILLRSAGPDGNIGTKDDISLTVKD